VVVVIKVYYQNIPQSEATLFQFTARVQACTYSDFSLNTSLPSEFTYNINDSAQLIIDPSTYTT